MSVSAASQMNGLLNFKYQGYKANHRLVGNQSEGGLFPSSIESNSNGASPAKQIGKESQYEASTVSEKAYLGKIWEQSEKDYQRWLDSQERWLKLEQLKLEDKYTRLERNQSQSTHPDYQPYAQVVAHGRIVAEVSNNGIVKSNTNLPKALQDLLGEIGSSQQGPAYAQVRAEKIASYFGGYVSKSETAVTQSEFDQAERPTIFQKSLDIEGMRRDEIFANLKEKMNKYNEFIERREEFISNQRGISDVEA